MTDARAAWCPAYVGVGSNLDDPVAQAERAFERLADLPCSRLVLRSSLYRSSPLGPQDQPDFVNGVAGLITRLEPAALLDALLGIEAALGRTRNERRWGPRRIDLDLLAVADRVIDTPRLVLPHPRIAERNFVLLPLAEISPELRLPGLGRVASIACDAREPRIERLD